MEVFKNMRADQHEQVVFCSDKVSKLRSIIAIHNTTLGPAIGGVRMFSYKSEEEALEDVLRLSQAMTYKAAAVGINLGGGQGVIIGDAQKDKNELILRSFGKFVDSLNGRFITAEDVGTTVEDMEIVRFETRYVTGLSKSLGGGGDPAVVSAIGVYYGLLASVEKVFNQKDLSGLSVIIQGLGAVGRNLAKKLKEAECKLIVTDIVKSKTDWAKEELKAEVIPPDEIYEVKADIFSPNALGGVINDKTIEKLKVKIVAGAANNQLEEDRHGELLQKKRILYAPDFVIGAGGLINVVNELQGYNQERAIKHAQGIQDILRKIFLTSEKENLSPNKAAYLLAEERLAQVKRLKQRHA
jgi:leucine dehydrogenase